MQMHNSSSRASEPVGSPSTLTDRFGHLPPTTLDTLPGYHIWAADLYRKRLASGSHYTVFNVVDLRTGQWIVGKVRDHFSSTLVIGDLEEAGRRHGLPDRLLVRNFVGSGRSDLTQWGRTNGVDVVQDAAISPVDGVGLSRKPEGQRFTSLEQVQRSVDKWRRALSRIDRGQLH